MRTSKLLNLFGIVIAILCLLAIPLQSQAEPKSKHKTEESTKERLVLMPLRVPEDDKNLTGAMETALVEGLQQKYDVFSGEQVSQKAHQIFLKESRNATHKECDETRCMQDIAEAFQTELIATANVTKQEDGYFIALSIRNVFDSKVAYSKSVPCQNCNTYQLVEKLKELVSKSSTDAKENSAISESDLWSEVKKGDSAEDYEAYLTKYPKGNHVALAKTRIKKLRSIAKLELAAWDNARKLSTVTSYKAYLQNYPDDLHADFAQAAINNLEPLQSNDPASVTTQLNLARAYLNGKGVSQNTTKAFTLAKQLAIQGYAEAQVLLGTMYSEGRGVTKDESKAFEWVQKSAAQGYGYAQALLGTMYLKGQGIAKDESKAFEWIQKSAMQGNALAQYVLGEMYLAGRGVTKNNSKAFEWFKKSAAQGNADAQNNLKAMGS